MTTPQQSALLAFASRIATNTLSTTDQSVLLEALGLIIPQWGFDGSGGPPGIDGNDGGTTEGNAGEWFAVLFAEATGLGGTSVDVLTQDTWWVAPATGNDANDGTTFATAVATWAEIARRQRGVSGGPGARAILNPTGGVVTYHVVGVTPLTDPISVVLDVDFAQGSSATFIGESPVVLHAGTLATASAFARTTTAGQLKITDGAVLDFKAFVPSLFVDTMSGAVAGLAAPTAFQGSSATGIISPGYSAQVPQVTFPVPTPVTVSGGDTYELLSLSGGYLGSAFEVRIFPEATATQFTQVTFYRMHFTEEFSGDFCQFNQLGGLTIVFQECIIEQGHSVAVGSDIVIYQNCGFSDPFISVQATDATVNLLAGFRTAGSFALGSAVVFIDCDCALFTLRPDAAATGGQFTFGNVGSWLFGGGGEALSIESSSLIVAPQFQATAIYYGQTSGPVIVVTLGTGGGTVGETSIIYFSKTGTGTPWQDHTSWNAPARSIQFDSTPFFFDDTSGLLVGPHAASFANIDTATPAGFKSAAGRCQLREGVTGARMISF